MINQDQNKSKWKNNRNMGIIEGWAQNRNEIINPDINRDIVQTNQMFSPGAIRSDKLSTFDTGNSGITDVKNTTPSVVIWGGSSFKNRDTAPFRVYDDGSLVASAGIITGIFTIGTGANQIIIDAVAGTISSSSGAWILRGNGTTAGLSAVQKNGVSTVNITNGTVTITHALGLVPKRILLGYTLNDLGGADGQYPHGTANIDISGQSGVFDGTGALGEQSMKYTGYCFTDGSTGGASQGKIQNLTTTTFDIVITNHAAVATLAWLISWAVEG